MVKKKKKDRFTEERKAIKERAQAFIKGMDQYNWAVEKWGKYNPIARTYFDWVAGMAKEFASVDIDNLGFRAECLNADGSMNTDSAVRWVFAH